MDTFHPILIYAAVMVGFVITNLVVIHLVGPSKKTAVKQMPYESGMDPVGDARQPFDVKFYLVAILFIIFDLEVAFLFPWAITLGATGIFAFCSMMVFLGVLTVGFIYEWKKGALEWE